VLKLKIQKHDGQQTQINKVLVIIINSHTRYHDIMVTTC